jgi:hypothetical protein
MTDNEVLYLALICYRCELLLRFECRPRKKSINLKSDDKTALYCMQLSGILVNSTADQRLLKLPSFHMCLLMKQQVVSDS